jgi:hypothetical protein
MARLAGIFFFSGAPPGPDGLEPISVTLVSTHGASVLEVDDVRARGGRVVERSGGSLDRVRRDIDRSGGGELACGSARVAGVGPLATDGPEDQRGRRDDHASRHGSPGDDGASTRKRERSASLFSTPCSHDPMRPRDGPCHSSFARRFRSAGV